MTQVEVWIFDAMLIPLMDWVMVQQTMPEDDLGGIDAELMSPGLLINVA